MTRRERVPFVRKSPGQREGREKGKTARAAAMPPERMERETKREREGCGHWATGPPCRRGCNEEEDWLPSTIRSLLYKERLGFNEICFDGVRGILAKDVYGVYISVTSLWRASYHILY